MGKAFKHHGELVSSDSTVVEEDTIHDLVIEAFASRGKTSTIAIAQQIILQTQSLLVDLVKDWQKQVLLFSALFVISNSRILIIDLSMLICGQFSLLKLSSVLIFPLKCVSHC